MQNIWILFKNNIYMTAIKKKKTFILTLFTLVALVTACSNTDSSNMNNPTANNQTTTENNNFNTSTLYTETLNKSLYPTITNINIKWNIGKIENTSQLNINAVRTYEAKTKIESELGLISMSEYMEASTNIDCSNGILASCSLDNYLDIKDSWTTTTTTSSVVYIDASKGISYETDLISAHHNIYRTLNVIPMEKSGTGTYSDPFIISIQES